MLRSTTLALVTLTVLSACSGPRGGSLQSIAADINATLYVGEDRISPGDQLELRFSSGPDLNQFVTVQADGHASFLDIGSVEVAGLLPEELRETLLKQYKAARERVNNLVVVVVTQASHNFHVMGEVHDSGSYALDQDGKVSILEALSMAGGHRKDTSWLGNTLLVRYDPETKEQRSWVLDFRERNWGGQQPVWIQQHDVLFIPNTRIDHAGIFLDMWVKRMIPWPNIVVPGGA
jgi:polysaccharide biosynthesis/export protein PslD